MPSHPIVEEFKRLLTRPHQFEANQKAWQQECEVVLGELPPEEAERVIRELQSLASNNRALFEQESRKIIDFLSESYERPQSQDKARQYRDVGKL